MNIKGYDVLRNNAVELTVGGGVIREIHEIKETGLPCLSTGFIDLQVNGYCGHDYSSGSLSIGDIYSITSELTVSGTTCHLPTIVTGEINKTINNIRTIVTAVNISKYLRNAIAGIHLEGPYISPDDGARGAHDKSFVKQPSVEELRRLYDASEGMVKIITLAPEIEGADKFIKEAVKLGIQIAIGHSNAKPSDIKRAVDCGLSLSTHLGNGIAQTIDRKENPLWVQLADDRIKSGIIADGFHLTKEQLTVFLRSKSMSNLFLVSDVGPMAGKEPGCYKWGNIHVEVHSDGRLSLKDTPYLAGAGHLLDWSIAHFMNLTDTGLKEVLPAVTVTPAGIIDKAASLEVGKPADLVLFTFNKGDSKLNIEKTIIDGHEVYSK